MPYRVNHIKDVDSRKQHVAVAIAMRHAAVGQFSL
jgi:hypothetical protein